MFSRRDFLQWMPVAMSAQHLSALSPVSDDIGHVPASGSMPLGERYPAYPAELIKQIVTVAHFDLKKLKELSEPHPQLVKAAWDWGFGDWETPLGAACHMGRRDIAEFLLSQGAASSIFSFVFFGDLHMVQQIIERQPGIQRTAGPHSISLLAHARMGGSHSGEVLAYLQSLGDADMVHPVPLTDKERNGLCGAYRFENDPSLQVDVTDDVRGYAGSAMYSYPPQLNWTRIGTMGRPLFHLGQNVFYPAGAPSIQIRFDQKGNTVRMTIADGLETLVASRVPGA